MPACWNADKLRLERNAERCKGSSPFAGKKHGEISSKVECKFVELTVMGSSPIFHPMEKEIEFAKLMIKNKGHCNGYSTKDEYDYSCTGCPYFENKKIKENEDFVCFAKHVYIFFVNFLKEKENRQLEFSFE